MHKNLKTKDEKPESEDKLKSFHFKGWQRSQILRCKTVNIRLNEWYMFEDDACTREESTAQNTMYDRGDTYHFTFAWSDITSKKSCRGSTITVLQDTCEEPRGSRGGNTSRKLQYSPPQSKSKVYSFVKLKHKILKMAKICTHSALWIFQNTHISKWAFYLDNGQSEIPNARSG